MNAAPPPPGLWSDLNMWRKFLALDGITAATRFTVQALCLHNSVRKDMTLDQRRESLDVGQVVTRVQHRPRSGLAHEALSGAPLPGPIRRNQLQHHLALDDLEAVVAGQSPEGRQEGPPRACGIRGLPIVHGQGGPLVLHPRPRDHCGRVAGPLCGIRPERPASW